MAKKKTTPKKVESMRHKDKRANIPTEELRDFVAEDEKAPKTMLYPRDPSLDPQLVWKGKDEQDQRDLAVPVVPIYIQEKIHPQAIIENLPANGLCGQEASRSQLLFADFNGLDDDFDKKVDFYKHEQHWTNRMILGDSLLVMTTLAEKEGLKGKVQMHLPRPALRHQVRLQLAGDHPQARRKGRQGRGRHQPARAGARLPRYLETGHPLLSGLPARPADRGPRPAHGDGQRLCADWG